MKTKFPVMLTFLLIPGLLYSGISVAEKSAVNKLNIYSGYYSREGNNEKMAIASGNNQYVRFFPKKRIVRLYIPYPYSKSVKPATINAAFNRVKNETSGSAYIKGKFGIMDEKIVAHLDFYHWVDNQVMYDCGKPRPCRVSFDDTSMTVIKPGLVLEHKIHYTLVND